MCTQIDSNSECEIVVSSKIDVDVTSEVACDERPVEEDVSYSVDLRDQLKLNWNEFDENAKDEGESDDGRDADSLKNELASWAIANNIAISASSKLLKILHNHDIDVPLDARTLYRTPRAGEIKVTELSGGSYCYFGVESCVMEQIQAMAPDVQIKEIKIDINIDGLPIFKSKNISVWPIQIAVVNIECLRNKPFVVAMFCGAHKPTNLDFLRDTVEELKKLMTNGLKALDFVVRHIICDAPARALVKGTVQFNGRYGCDFCEERGKFDGRMLFLEKGPLRTNDSFRQKRNPDHHKYPSPFLELKIDMIKQFPIDPMHCVDLGVTKRIMLLWKEGLRQYRLSQRQISIISDFNEAISSYFPSAFQRKPRRLDELKMWKATEFRMFLLYIGPVILKWVLEKDEYELFLCLSISVSILLNESLMEEHCAYADELLNYFVQKAKVRYSERFCAYNVHSLLHLADCAKIGGSLMECAAYKFENNMSAIKRSVRGTGNPIVQIANRMREKFLSEHPSNNGMKDERGIPLKSDAKKCYCLQNGQFAQIHDVKGEEVLCQIFTETKPFYLKPCDSRIVGLYRASKRRTRMRMVKKSEVKEEAILMPLVFIEDSSTDVCLLKLKNKL